MFGPLVLGCCGIEPPALPTARLAAANLKLALEREARVGQNPAGVPLGLSFGVFEGECFVGDFAAEGELVPVAIGAGDVTTGLRQLDGADRRAPLAVEGGFASPQGGGQGREQE